MAAVESETEMVGDGDSLAEGDDVAESKGEAEPAKEAVARGAVAVAASEALPGEADREGEEDCDGDATEEAELQGVPLALLRPLLLADGHPDTLGHCEAVGEIAGVVVELSVGWGVMLSLGEEEVQGELLRLSA